MKKYFCLILIILPLLLNSCATVLNGRYQEIRITAADSTDIFVNSEKINADSAKNVVVDRAAIATHVIIDKKGYMHDTYALVPVERSSLYILSWIPFGAVFFLPPLLDVGPNAYNFKDTYNFEPRTKMPIWDENLKRIFIDNISFNVEDSLHTQISTDYNKFKGYGDGLYHEEKKDSIKIESTVFAEFLYNKLKTNGFVDTTETVFYEFHNIYKLEGTVKELNFYWVMSVGRNRSYTTIKGTTEWKLKNAYDREILTKRIETNSSEYGNGYDRGELAMNLALMDYMERSMYEFMNDPEVKQHLNRDTNTRISYDEITSIKKPEKQPMNIDNAMKAVVTIKNKDGHGSGFFISNDGYIITNCHVVTGEEEDIEVILENGDKIKPEIIRKNEIYDLALIKIENEAEYAFSIPNEKEFTTGDEIFAIGSPRSIELGQSVSKGIISSVRKYKSYDWIQTDVSVNPGNSGGSLVNKDGELIGVVDFKVVGFGFEGISFCIPAYNISSILNLEINN